LIIRVINFAKGRSTSYKLAPEVGAVGIVGAVGVVGVVGYKLAPAGGGVQATSLHQRGERWEWWERWLQARASGVQATSLHQRKNSDNLGESRRR